MVELLPALDDQCSGATGVHRRPAGSTEVPNPPSWTCPARP